MAIGPDPRAPDAGPSAAAGGGGRSAGSSAHVMPTWRARDARSAHPRGPTPKTRELSGNGTPATFEEDGAAPEDSPGRSDERGRALRGGNARQPRRLDRAKPFANRRSVLASVAAASASTSMPRSSAMCFAVWTTSAGSHRFPRRGTGARYGLSVSTRMRSSGAHAATVLDGARGLERHDARERQVEPERERALGERPVLAEAVDDPADVARALLLEDRQRVVGGRSRVDDDGLSDARARGR